MTEGDTKDTSTGTMSIPISHRLAVTWRQVKRIMMSAFVVIFAYWHGEMIQEEASRYVAMARLLLEYPRWRWGEKLDEAVRSLIDIGDLGGLQLIEHMRRLLPGASEQALGRLLTKCQPGDTTSEATALRTVSSYVPVSVASKFCPEVSDAPTIDYFFGFDTELNAFQDNLLFGL